MLLLVLSFFFFFPALSEAHSFIWDGETPLFTETEEVFPETEPSFPLPFFPVKIQDKALEEGAFLELYRDPETRGLSLLPRKKVFLPFPFYLRIEEKGAVQPVFLRVYPQMSHRLSFDVERRGDFGLVFYASYKDVLETTFLDMLNEIKRRDMHLKARKKNEQGEFTGTEIRNLFNNQNPRAIDLVKRKKIAPSLFLDFRVDNIARRKGIEFGTNIVVDQKKREFLFGNVLHKVENELSFQVREKRSWGDVTFRAEHFTFRRDPDFSAQGLFIKKIGGRIALTHGGFFLKAGNLKVERVLQDIEEGKVDSQFNLEIGQSFFWGNPFFGLRKKWVLSGESGLSLVSFGSQSFLRGHLFQDIYFKQTYGLNARWFSDFIKVHGDEANPPFQDLRLTLIQQRKLFGDKTLLGKWNFSHLFLESEWKKRGRGKPFFSHPAIRFGFGREIWLYRFSFPFEFGMEWQDRKTLKFFFQVSTRAWL